MQNMGWPTWVIIVCWIRIGLHVPSPLGLHVMSLAIRASCSSPLGLHVPSPLGLHVASPLGFRKAVKLFRAWRHPVRPGARLLSVLAPAC